MEYFLAIAKKSDDIVEKIITIMTKAENKTECKVSVFKELRNLPDQDILEIFDRCLDEDITPQGINKTAKQKMHCTMSDLLFATP